MKSILVASAAVHSKVMALWLLIHCFSLLPMFVGFVFGPCFCNAVLNALSSFFHCGRESWLLYFNCVLAVL